MERGGDERGRTLYPPDVTWRRWWRGRFRVVVAVVGAERARRGVRCGVGGKKFCGEAITIAIMSEHSGTTPP